MGLVSVAAITIAGVLSMIGSGINPLPGRVISATIPTTFENAFLSITSPVSYSRCRENGSGYVYLTQTGIWLCRYVSFAHAHAQG
jgi:hypothetical protein